MPLTAADLTLRDAVLDDAPFVADVWTAARPHEPQDPVMTRYWWEHPWDDSVATRYVASLRGANVGFAAFAHPAWERTPERYSRLQLELVPAARTVERLAALTALLEVWSRDDGAERASAWAWQDDRPKIDALGSRGFREARRQRFWELDLPANLARIEEMAAASRRRMREQDIELSTLDRVDDAEKVRKLWRLFDESERDIPTTLPHVAVPFATFEASFRAPNVREDRVWVARRGDAIVGTSFLQFPPVRGHVETGYTGTVRAVRGLGSARALKCETVLQAAALGVDRVRTDNDSENAPILHLNASMGYRVVAEMIQLIADL